VAEDMIIDGLKISSEILAELKKQPKPNKSLVAILVGANPASVSFLRQKEKAAKNLGVDFKILNFQENISENGLITEIKRLNSDQKNGGIIIQLPLPASISTGAVIKAIDSRKDVDNLKGDNLVPAPAVLVVQEVLKHLKFFVKGKKSVVIGRGLLVGAPLVQWFETQGAQVAVLHTGAFDKKALLEADLIISGDGQPNLIKGPMFKSGAILIDFGIDFENGKLTGDLDFASCEAKAAFITPTPGGTGPILVAKLFENFYRLTNC